MVPFRPFMWRPGSLFGATSFQGLGGVEYPSPTAPFTPAVGRWELLPIPFMLSALMENKFSKPGRKDEKQPL
jgi:hypothetical protein